MDDDILLQYNLAHLHKDVLVFMLATGVIMEQQACIPMTLQCWGQRN